MHYIGLNVIKKIILYLVLKISSFNCKIVPKSDDNTPENLYGCGRNGHVATALAPAWQSDLS